MVYIASKTMTSWNAIGYIHIHLFSAASTIHFHSFDILHFRLKAVQNLFFDLEQSPTEAESSHRVIFAALNLQGCLHSFVTSIRRGGDTQRR